MKNLSAYLEERKKPKKEEKYRVVVISTEKGKDSITANRIKEESDKLGYPVYVTKMNGTYTKVEDNIRTIHREEDDKGFEIHSDDTVVFVRGTPERDSWLDLISQLEKAGYCVVNSRDCMELASDKYRTYLRLQDFGLTQPKTVLIPNENGIENSFNSLDTKFPIVMKTLRGSKGVGVLFIESERGLKSLVQLLFKQDKYSDILIQEYKKTDFDVRVLVLDGTIIATMKRDVLEGDFRSNYSQGAKVTTYDLTNLEIEQCLLAAKAVGGLFTAVDFIPSEKPKNDPPHILEVNSSPGTEGIEEANNKNIVNELLTHFNNPELRYTSPIECGWEEVVDIKPFGKLTAKFDTGNYKYPVLHAEDVKVNGNTITFRHKDKTIKTKLVGEYTSVTGAGEDDRHIVELDLIFSGTVYEKILFGLDNRDRLGTDVLLNRKTMKKLNVIINPQRKYLVTTKFAVKKSIKK
jgi:ribosomal protein S6--L-glutamate ligase